MNSEFEFDLTRLRREIESHQAASEKRLEWGSKENRHRENIQSLLQLIVNEAVELSEIIPPWAVEQANRYGIPVPEATKEKTRSPELASEQPKAQEESLEHPAPTAAAVDNKTKFVRWIISEKQSTGVTPAEIKELARGHGKDVGGNFPHGILFRLKSQNEIREEGGRYYPVDGTEW